MDDIKKEFISESKDRAITARSAHSTRTHNGKGGKAILPSDKMTESQIKAQHGPVKTWDLNRPMSWTSFRSMPIDLEREYIQKLREKFACSNQMLADMMGVAAPSVSRELKRIGMDARNFHIRPDNVSRTEFHAFCKPPVVVLDDKSTIIPEQAKEAEEKASMFFAPFARTAGPDYEALFTESKAECDRLNKIIVAQEAAMTAQEQELDILRGQMKVVWGFLGKDECNA